ncbi:hypothetical protein Adt_27120 [Abeliophyllum distichum]|uniref:Uncharacterized protein n=1 Tax=Abeliophyllum distichum TaxID=126358 RepID=A0ABD1RSU4_9LAMI
MVMMQSCNPRTRHIAGESKPLKFNAIVINCSRLIATSEETHDRQSNSTSTCGSSFNARTTQRHLCASASPTGTLPPCSLLLPWSNASLKCLSHWDSATLQPVPPME